MQYNYTISEEVFATSLEEGFALLGKSSKAIHRILSSAMAQSAI